MKKYSKILRQAAAACDELNNLVLGIMMFAFLLTLVIAGWLWSWWYPINYLTEGDQFHERRVTEFMKCVGFKNIAHVNLVMPKNQFRNFETTCSAWATSGGGKTFLPVEFNYRYDRRAWLEGTSSFLPTRKSFADEHPSVFNQYLKWSGKTREQFEEMLALKQAGLPEKSPN